MRYYLTDMNISHSIGGSMINAPGNSCLSIQVTLEVEEYTTDEISSIENLEKALNGDFHHKDAPTYYELLRTYHPEFLL